ncbi:MAG: hypothetical protein RLZZ156_440 [Deinococcota bacterium]|jgi:hypothetical protein
MSEVTVVLIPLIGTISSRIFENPFLGIARGIVYGINIPLFSFEFEGNTQETAVCLDFIRFPVSEWRELEHQEYFFPINPIDGYIDGSVYLENAHHPADVTRVHFGKLEQGSILVTLEIEFDFTLEGLDSLGKPKYIWKTMLHIDSMAD